MSKIFLDPGHGGSDNGASANGLLEDNMNLITETECVTELLRYGVEVKTSRNSDVAVGLSERATMASNWGADYFVSIHYNAGGGDGIEVIHSKYNGKGLELAKNIVSSVCNETGQNARPTPTYSKIGSDGKDYFAVIRETSMDAIIVECGFIDSADKDLFDTVEEQKAMGKAIAHGILKQLNIAVIQEIKAIPKPSGEQTYFRAVAGSYLDRANCEATVTKLRSLGFDAFIDIYKK